MTNLERFTRALDREPVDRVLTWDFVDNQQVLVRHGGYDPSRNATRHPSTASAWT